MAGDTQDSSPDGEPTASHDRESTDSRSLADRPQLKRPLVALAALLALNVLVGVATRLTDLPLNRAIELRYCQEYYATQDPSLIGPNGEIPEVRCKVDVIQQSLGWMQGTLGTLALLCDIAVTAPMGVVVDRIGVRLGLLLNLSAIGVFISWLALVGKLWTVFPVNAMLAAPFLSLFGGGGCVARMAVLAMVTQIAGTDQKLPTYLAYVSSTEYVTSLATPPLAALLLEQSIWIPFWVGLACLAAAMPLTALLPDNRSEKRSPTKVNNQSVSELQSETTPLLASQPPTGVDERPPQSTMSSVGQSLRDYAQLLRKSRAFQVLLAVFFVKGAANSANVVLLQYISKRFKWTFAQVGYLFTLKAAVNIFFLTVAVPAWSRLLGKKLGPARAEMLGSRVFTLALAIGAGLIASSSAIWALVIALLIYASGTVAPVFLYALAKSAPIGLITQENQGKAFAVIVLCTSLGSLAGLPACTAIWIKAIDLGEAALGLPYYFSSTLYIVAFIGLWLLKLPYGSQSSPSI